MKNPPPGRHTLVIPVMLLVLAAVSAEATAFDYGHLDHHDHECSGEECPVCLCMRIAGSIFEALGRCGLSACPAGIFPVKTVIQIHLLSSVSRATPVELKVKSTT